jgi:Xaa-Pro aminopeptidase
MIAVPGGISMSDQKNDPYFIDFPERVKKMQEEMAKEKIDVYLGSRLRTMSWITGVFCPWRSFIVIPASGRPIPVIFVLDVGRIADESWVEQENFRVFPSPDGKEQIQVITETIKTLLPKGGRIGIESGMSNYLPEGFITHEEYLYLKDSLSNCEMVNAYDILERLAIIKDEGTINRFREASRIVDVGQQAVLDAIKNGGWKGMTETEIGGLAAYAMRKAGSVWEWSFTGGNEIASGPRTGYYYGACTPATTRKLQHGDVLLADLHATFKLGLGDHSHNYILGSAAERQLWHAGNFVDFVQLILGAYRAGATPLSLLMQGLALAKERGFENFIVPGVEHGIGMLGDEWRIGPGTKETPFWTDKQHVYRANEMVICAIQYFCAEEQIGFRYENPILITESGCEYMSKFPLSVDVIE